MGEVDKILKDAAKITGGLYLAYGYVQSPMQALSFYCQSEPSDFIATIYKPSACLYLRDGKMVEFSGKRYRYDIQKFLQYCAKSD